MTASSLFQPIRLADLALANRIVVAPMCQYSAKSGEAGAWHQMHLGQMAVSGAGLVILEATAVAPEGRISAADLGLYSDETAKALGDVLAAVRAWSPTPLGVQLSHAGRKASVHPPWTGGAQLPLAEGGWRTLAPSPLAFRHDRTTPLSLDADGLARVRAQFVAAARRAAILGLDLIEIHAAHGYLLHQFLSPLANQRDDAYGGSLENRMRLPLEVFEAVREAFPAGRPVGVRLSATDWVAGGWDLEQTLALAQALAARGADYLHISSGGLSPDQAIAPYPGYQVPFARAVRQVVDIPVIAVGLITEPEHADAIIGVGDADLVGLARAMLYDPRWPWHAAARLGASVHVPSQYLRCQPRRFPDLFIP